MRIKHINHGIGCRIGETIFLNKKLLKYPRLHNAILKHEKAHTEGARYSSEDLLLDFKGKHLKELKKEYYGFILKHPSSWTEFLPFWVYEGKIAVNPLISGIWVVFLMFCSVIIWRMTWR